MCCDFIKWYSNVNVTLPYAASTLVTNWIAVELTILCYEFDHYGVMGYIKFALKSFDINRIEVRCKVWNVAVNVPFGCTFLLHTLSIYCYSYWIFFGASTFPSHLLIMSLIKHEEHYVAYINWYLVWDVKFFVCKIIYFVKSVDNNLFRIGFYI